MQSPETAPGVSRVGRGSRLLGGVTGGLHTPAAINCVIPQVPAPLDTAKQEVASASLGAGEGIQSSHVETAAVTESSLWAQSFTGTSHAVLRAPLWRGVSTVLLHMRKLRPGGS